MAMISPEKFRVERIRRNFTQGEVAEKIGYPVSVVGSVENGLPLHPEEMERWYSTLKSMGTKQKVRRNRRREHATA
jgi:transcriptional regulator with XRE-family HTH domain